MPQSAADTGMLIKKMPFRRDVGVLGPFQICTGTAGREEAASPEAGQEVRLLQAVPSRCPERRRHGCC